MQMRTCRIIHLHIGQVGRGTIDMPRPPVADPYGLDALVLAAIFVIL
jgi:hypothetical protein